jgi:hypothetical protein
VSVKKNNFKILNLLLYIFNKFRSFFSIQIIRSPACGALPTHPLKGCVGKAPLQQTGNIKLIKNMEPLLSQNKLIRLQVGVESTSINTAERYNYDNLTVNRTINGFRFLKWIVPYQFFFLKSIQISVPKPIQKYNLTIKTKVNKPFVHNIKTNLNFLNKIQK